MADDEADERFRERGDERSSVLWFVLDADRWLVSGLFSALVLVGIVTIGILHPTPAQTLLTRGDSVETLYQALVTATITGVTLVLTLSQLVLSQELGAVGDQRERMEGSLSFREDVADAVGAAASPAEPSAFLRSLVRATAEQAHAIEDAADEESLDPELDELLSTYLDSVIGNAESVASQLEGAAFGEFDVVRAALNYNYSWKLYAGRRIRETYAGALPEAVDDELAELVETLELFGPAREHFKTLYFQWELSTLSRTLLYVAVPALGVAISALLFLDPQDITGTTLGIADSLLLVAVTTTVALLPFTILLAYILRIVTVTKRTLSIGPFILRETDRSVDVSWD
ncbi:hypothetical protein [Haloarcula montana]|uniref:hypothetical protein n=1 Tax=Haloarcula montana TaxID=3111776 RepID=UPI002D7770DB|nr:hypothetical protein [Haloarcula sp. GH36]